MTQTNILVTGATGLSGTHVINEFIQKGIPVRALVRAPEKARSMERVPGVELVEGDMLHPASLHRALEGIERALLISSSNEQMVETQCSFIDACKHQGVPHVIKFSGEESQLGYNAANFRFGREHNQIEDYLERSGLQWTHLRPSQFMQVYLREAATIKDKGELLLPLEDITLSPVDQRDIAKITVSLLIQGGHKSERLRITGPEALSMAAIAAIIAKVTGKPVRYTKISIAERSKSLLSTGIAPYLVEAIAAQSAERCRNPQAFVDLSTHRLFDVAPTYFEQFALRHAVDFGK